MSGDPENSAALAKLAREIHEEHEKASAALRQGLGHALKAGKLLLRARSLCEYGSWESWVRENCEFALSTARLYMQLARDEELLKSLSVSASPLTITEARKILRDVRLGEPLDDDERREREELAELKLLMRTELNSVGRDLLRSHVATKGNDRLRYAYALDQQQLLARLCDAWRKAEDPTRRKFLRWLKSNFGLRLEKIDYRFRTRKIAGGEVVQIRPKGRNRKSGPAFPKPHAPEDP